MSDLAEKTCLPCQGGIPALFGEPLKVLQSALNGAWQVVDGHHLTREYAFKDFREALRFTNQVGELAEAQNHHPDLFLSWGKVKISLWTHKVDGLTESDFILAAKIDALTPSD